MRISLRFILLLVLSIALRGLAGPAYAAPSMLQTPMQMSDCLEHAAAAQQIHAHHQPGDKACQISCDLSASPVLPVSFVPGVHALPAVMMATLPLLLIREATPPDHPPPIC